jgi:hypothetical protein
MFKRRDIMNVNIPALEKLHCSIAGQSRWNDSITFAGWVLRAIHDANSKAISWWANVPPYLPDFEIMPMAPVASIHF